MPCLQSSAGCEPAAPPLVTRGPVLLCVFLGVIPHNAGLFCTIWVTRSQKLGLGSWPCVPGLPAFPARRQEDKQGFREARNRRTAQGPCHSFGNNNWKNPGKMGWEKVTRKSDSRREKGSGLQTSNSDRHSNKSPLPKKVGRLPKTGVVYTHTHIHSVIGVSRPPQGSSLGDTAHAAHSP